MNFITVARGYSKEIGLKELDKFKSILRKEEHEITRKIKSR